MMAAPSISSTDKSVCATWIVLYSNKCWCTGERVWHRHSCLCFGKVARLDLQTRTAA